VLVADARMPQTGGAELLRRVKSLHPQIACIMLSGCTAADSATEAINEGAVLKFFTKPWDDEQLRAEIAEAFRQQAPRHGSTGSRPAVMPVEAAP